MKKLSQIQEVTPLRLIILLALASTNMILLSSCTTLRPAKLGKQTPGSNCSPPQLPAWWSTLRMTTSPVCRRTAPTHEMQE